MFAALYVNGRPVADPLGGDTEAVTLEFPTGATVTHRCRTCGDDLAETTGGTFAGETSGVHCPDFAAPDGHGGDGEGEGGGDDGPHLPERVPLSWCNHAGISTDEADDSVTVSVSVGDPRGAFTFTLRHVPDDADGDLAGRLVLHVPYPGEALPHAELTPLAAGTYVVGGVPQRRPARQAGR